MAGDDSSIAADANPPLPLAQQGEALRVETNDKGINAELWHACAGPLATIPPAGSLVVYFPQGHSQQVAASMGKDVNVHIPGYPNLPSKLICLLHSATLHADSETDEVYARMTLQPVNVSNMESILASDLSLKTNKPQPEFFCKTLTASDTSTHGGFSVPRRAAERIFPPLDFSMQPPAQELQAKDLHDNVWNFRHIYRGQPKRHLLTTGWSSFVSGKHLQAGDSVLFIRDANSHLLLGIRRANRQLSSIPSSVLSSDCMHIGILAAAAHAASNNSPFTIFYNPRASPSEFVIPLSKYNKAIYGYQISLGMRFRMLFETEDSGTRRYMGTVTGISDLDSIRWKNSQWHNLQVTWDETTVGDRPDRVSVWEVEPILAPFFVFPPFCGSKHPRQPDEELMDTERILKKTGPWFGEDICGKALGSQNDVMSGLSLAQWMAMQHSSLLANSGAQSLDGGFQTAAATDFSRQLYPQAQLLQQTNMQFIAQKAAQQRPQLDPLSTLCSPSGLVGEISLPLQQLPDVSLLRSHQLFNQACPSNQLQGTVTQPEILFSSQVKSQSEPQTQQQHLLQSLQPSLSSLLQNQPPSFLQCNRQLPSPLQNQLPQSSLLYHQQSPQQKLENKMAIQNPPQSKPQLHLSEQQIQLQLLHNFQKQQQTLSPRPILQQHVPFHEQHNSFLEASQLPNTHLLSQQKSGQENIANKNSPAINCLQIQQHQVQTKPQNEKHVAADLPGQIPTVPPKNILPASGSCLPISAGAHSELTDDDPSCSTSPSAGNAPSFTPQKIVSINHINADSIILNKDSFSSANLKSCTFGFPLVHLRKEENPGNQTNAPIIIHKQENLGKANPQGYRESAALVDYVESSSSATSNCISLSDAYPQSCPPSGICSPILINHATVNNDFQVLHAADPEGKAFVGINVDSQLGHLMSHPLLAENLGSSNNFESDFSYRSIVENLSRKRPQQTPLPSFISRSFIQNGGYNSIDLEIKKHSLPNLCSPAAPPQQFQRIRTYTKVYKRGSVGRSIDVNRYSGYGELKHDLSRMFGLGGQLEDLQRQGWKLVYVDHENDVLLVGDDPWEEFTNCVKCIKILSPQEVRQMSMEGDLGKDKPLNEDGSSSDGGNAWHCQL